MSRPVIPHISAITCCSSHAKTILHCTAAILTTEWEISAFISRLESLSNVTLNIWRGLSSLPGLQRASLALQDLRARKSSHVLCQQHIPACALKECSALERTQPGQRHRRPKTINEHMWRWRKTAFLLLMPTSADFKSCL